MKKIILPILLLIAGIGLIAYPFFLSSGDIDLQIKPAGFIMPAAYKVYNNPEILGGRFNLFKAIIKNPGNSEIRNLKVQYQVPDIINEWTDIPAATNLLPGQTAVVTCFPDFPESITGRNTASKATAKIRITYGSKGNPVERDEAFTFDITSVNDIVFNSMPDQDKAFVGDMGENDVLYACMVASEDPVIKAYAAKIQGKVLCGEEGAGVGGSGDVTQKDLDEKRRVMEGVYEGTLASQMHYSETSADLVTFSDGNTSGTEHIRLPREVVGNNTGLCIELALTHASVYKAAGLNPVIFLIPGHAYPGIKVGSGYMAIEATGIGMNGQSMSPDQAYATGIHELGEFFDAVKKGDPRYKILDINQLNSQGFQEMELKTDPTLQKGMDDNTANWPACFATYFARAAAAAAAHSTALAVTHTHNIRSGARKRNQQYSNTYPSNTNNISQNTNNNMPTTRAERNAERRKKIKEKFKSFFHSL